MSYLPTPAATRLLELSSRPGVGAGTLRKIAQSAMSLPSLLHDEAHIERLTTRTSTAKQSPDAWRRIIEDCERLSIRVISCLDPDYPVRLLSIDDFPPLLYVRGPETALSMRGCAVVGTREASRLGLSWARQIAEVVASKGMSVVSGLALGIDTAAHEGCLKAGGTTIAILAHGLDRVTPHSNRALAERILEREGCLVAEHAPGVPPVRQEYVRRNRIQSGMSACSVMVESGQDGGAIHQGHFATRQGRPLFCVMPPKETPGADDFRYEGAERLAKEAKARPIGSRAELERALDNLERSVDDDKSPLRLL